MILYLAVVFQHCSEQKNTPTMLSKQKEIETTMENKDMGMFFVKTVYSITIQFNFLR